VPFYPFPGFRKGMIEQISEVPWPRRLSDFRYSPFETHRYFYWFRAQWANSLLDLDTQSQNAASRRWLRIGARQRSSASYSSI